MNHLPTGVSGEPDVVYEKYVAAGLEFLLGSRVIRYGSQRRYDPLPDGLMLPRSEGIVFPYDTKAASPAFTLGRDDIRRFGD